MSSDNMIDNLSDDLMDHAHKCFEMAQVANFYNLMCPDPEMAKAAQKWHKAGERAEHRAILIEIGKDGKG